MCARLLGGLDPRHTLEAAQQLRSFDRPVLLAWSKEDHFFPPEHAERLAALVPDATARVDRGLAAPSARRTSPSAWPG